MRHAGVGGTALHLTGWVRTSEHSRIIRKRRPVPSSLAWTWAWPIIYFIGGLSRQARQILNVAV